MSILEFFFELLDVTKFSNNTLLHFFYAMKQSNHLINVGKNTMNNSRFGRSFALLRVSEKRKVECFFTMYDSILLIFQNKKNDNQFKSINQT